MVALFLSFTFSFCSFALSFVRFFPFVGSFFRSFALSLVDSSVYVFRRVFIVNSLLILQNFSTARKSGNILFVILKSVFRPTLVRVWKVAHYPTFHTLMSVGRKKLLSMGYVRKFVAFTEKYEFYDIMMIINFLDRFVSRSIEKTSKISFKPLFWQKTPLKLGLAYRNVRDRIFWKFTIYLRCAEIISSDCSSNI